MIPAAAQGYWVARIGEQLVAAFDGRPTVDQARAVFLGAEVSINIEPATGDDLRHVVAGGGVIHYLTEKTAMTKYHETSVPEALGFDPDEDPEALEALVFDSVVPACCAAGCQVEPDGRCPHGHPSVLQLLGVI